MPMLNFLGFSKNNGAFSCAGLDRIAVRPIFPAANSSRNTPKAPRWHCSPLDWACPLGMLSLHRQPLLHRTSFKFTLNIVRSDHSMSSSRKFSRASTSFSPKSLTTKWPPFSKNGVPNFYSLDKPLALSTTASPQTFPVPRLSLLLLNQSDRTRL